MITPAVAIDGAFVSGSDPVLTVGLRNLDPATGQALTSFPGYGPVTAVFARLGTRVVNGPIYDQLGWTDMPGAHLTIEASVEIAPGRDGTARISVVLSGVGASCDASDAGT